MFYLKNRNELKTNRMFIPQNLAPSRKMGCESHSYAERMVTSVQRTFLAQDPTFHVGYQFISKIKQVMHNNGAVLFEFFYPLPSYTVL